MNIKQLKNLGLKKIQSIPVSSNGYYEYKDQPVIVPTPTGKITMKGVDKEIDAYAMNGKHLKTMQPGENYTFKGNKAILEIPKAQDGSKVAIIPPFDNRLYNTKLDFNNQLVNTNPVIRYVDPSQPVSNTFPTQPNPSILGRSMWQQSSYTPNPTVVTTSPSPGLLGHGMLNNNIANPNTPLAQGVQKQGVQNSGMTLAEYAQANNKIPAPINAGFNMYKYLSEAPANENPHYRQVDDEMSILRNMRSNPNTRPIILQHNTLASDIDNNSLSSSSRNANRLANTLNTQSVIDDAYNKSNVLNNQYAAQYANALDAEATNRQAELNATVDSNFAHKAVHDAYESAAMKGYNDWNKMRTEANRDDKKMGLDIAVATANSPYDFNVDPKTGKITSKLKEGVDLSKIFMSNQDLQNIMLKQQEEDRIKREKAKQEALTKEEKPVKEEFGGSLTNYPNQSGAYVKRINDYINRIIN